MGKGDSQQDAWNRFAETARSLGLSAAAFSAQLLPAIAFLASGNSTDALSALAYVATLVGRASWNRLLEYPMEVILAKLARDPGSGVSSGPSEQPYWKLAESMEAVQHDLAELSRQNSSLDAAIAQLTKVLVGRDEFLALSQSIGGLSSGVERLEAEADAVIRQNDEEKATAAAISHVVPTIRTLLDQDGPSDPTFFRPEGPRWVDFEEGYVHKSPLVDDTIERLKKWGMVVLKGSPASGKSVILRNVGYELAKNTGADVYYIGLKKIPNPEMLLLQISKIRHGYVMVDDAHLNVDFVDQLILVQRDRSTSHAGLLIASRVVDMASVYGPTSELLFPEYLSNKSTIEVTADSVADNIVTMFNAKRARDQKSVISGSHRGTLARDNLWILAWQLKSFERFGRVNRKHVLETMMEYVEGLEGATDGAVGAILLISMFYRYEVPVRKEFVDSIAGQRVVWQLRRAGEVATIKSRNKRYVALWHSEVARMYVSTFSFFGELGANARQAIDTEYANCCRKNNEALLTTKAISVYFEKYPAEITASLPTLLDHVPSRRLVREMHENCTSYIVRALDRESDAKKIASCLHSYVPALGPRRAKEFVRALDMGKLVRKVKKEENPSVVGEILAALNYGDTQSAIEALAAVTTENLVTKITGRADAESTVMCIGNVSEIDADVGQDLLNVLDMATLAAKIATDRYDAFNIGYCLSHLAELTEDGARKTVHALDIPTLVTTLNTDNSLPSIVYCIWTISALDTTLAKRIAESLDISGFGSKVNSDDVEYPSMNIAMMYDVSPKVAQQVLALLDISPLVERLDADFRRGVPILGLHVLEGIARVDKVLAGEVVRGLDIDAIVAWALQESSVSNLGYGIGFFYGVNPGIAKRVVKVLDSARLAGLINKGTWLVDVGRILAVLSKVNRHFANEVLRSANIASFSKRISGEFYLPIIADFISDIASVDAKTARRLVGVMDVDAAVLKMRQEEDRAQVGILLVALARVSPKTARRMARQSDPRSISAGSRADRAVVRVNQRVAVGAGLMFGGSAESRQEVYLKRLAHDIRDFGAVDTTTAHQILDTMPSAVQERVSELLECAEGMGQR